MTTYHPSLSAFITNKTPSGVEKHHESTEPGKMISFFFRRASSKFAWTSHSGLCTKQQHFILSSAQPHRFYNFKALILKNYGFQFGTQFSCMDVSCSTFQSSNPIGRNIIHNYMRICAVALTTP